MKTLVVIPTYNEAGTIRALVEAIHALAVPTLSMLVVDDNSPDRTADIAEELSRRYPVRVMRRAEKQGVGRAYVAAFGQILADSHSLPDYIIQMDADMSHDPRAIPAMLGAIRTSDIVIGSRYTPGGKIENWNAIRRGISRVGNAYARAMLRVPYRDLTSGYRCFRREALARLDLESISSSGYCFMIEIAARAHMLGLRIHEIPIVFTERTIGASKFNLRIIMESIWRVAILAIRSGQK